MNERQNHVLILHRISFGLKDAAPICSELVTNQFTQVRLEEMETASYIFKTRDVIIICFVDDLFIIARDEIVMRKPQLKFSKAFKTKDPGK